MQNLNTASAHVKTIDPRLQRIAFVQEWSDALIERMLQFYAAETNIDTIIHIIQGAADDLMLSVLRNDDSKLQERAAQALGFNSIAEYVDFKQCHPMLYERLSANPVLSSEQGRILEMSLTEVAFTSSDGRVFVFERARLQSGINIGDFISVSKMGAVAKLASNSVANANTSFRQSR